MKFITGIIYKLNTEERKQKNIEAVSVFDSTTKTTTLTSMTKIKQMLMSGEKINDYQ